MIRKINDCCEYCAEKERCGDDEMIETIWIYDNKEISSNNISNVYKLTDEERYRFEKEDKEYLESLSEEEREWQKNSASNINLEEWKKEKEERNRKYDGGTVIKTKFLKIDNGFNEDIHEFTAVLKDGKIGIFYPNLFCDYLRSEKELDIFFRNIDITSYRIEGDTRKIEYRRNAEHVTIRFEVEEMINNRIMTLSFSDGKWFSYHWKNDGKFGWTLENDQIACWSLDISEWDRDTIIKEIIEYDNKFVPISKELIIEKMQDKINRMNCIWEDYDNGKIGKKAWRKRVYGEVIVICNQIQEYGICDQCRNFEICKTKVLQDDNEKL